MCWLVLSAVTDNASDSPVSHRVCTRNAPDSNRDVLALLKLAFWHFFDRENRADTKTVLNPHGRAVFWREQVDTGIPVVNFIADNYFVADPDVAELHSVSSVEYGFHF